jgi:glycosyltransferase involved in cell wall biosynthesis
MKEAALVIATPWGWSGSTNIFAAQCAYFKRRGVPVALLLSIGGDPSPRSVRPLGEASERAMFDADIVCRTLRVKQWPFSGYLRWLRQGADSYLGIMARHMAAARLPEELERFLLVHGCRIILVNHCFQIAVAEKVCSFLKENERGRPRILLETHDVQAEQYAANRTVNIYTRQKDSKELLARDELEMTSRADVLLHVSEQDEQYFAKHLSISHKVVFGTIDPASEKELKAINDQGYPILFDFLYIGAVNFGNEASLLWFLNQVCPLLNAGFRVAIVGSVCAQIRLIDPLLYDRYRTWFIGEVDDIVPFYKRSRVVLLPTRFVTGTSIKTIEALASGKPVVATSLALRSIPAAVIESAGIKGHDTAEAFAEAMTAALKPDAQEARGFAEIYDQAFSNRAYFARYDEVLSGLD